MGDDGLRFSWIDALRHEAVAIAERATLELAAWRNVDDVQALAAIKGPVLDYGHRRRQRDGPQLLASGEGAATDRFKGQRQPHMFEGLAKRSHERSEETKEGVCA